MHRTPDEQLCHFLSDLYAMELQALAQLESAPAIAGSESLADALRLHLEETRDHARAVREALEACGGTPSTVKDSVMKAGGKGFILFAKMQTETPGRLATHAYAYEAMEWAAYAVLARLAEIAGNSEVALLARRIGAEEQCMMERLEGQFRHAEEAAHRDVPRAEMTRHVQRHLAEMHALEVQGAKLLERRAASGSSPELNPLYDQLHASSTRRLAHLQARLEDLGGSRSVLEDMAMKLGALQWDLFFRLQGDSPAKHAVFNYAIAFLRIGGYEMLLRTARRAYDAETVRLCEEHLTDEHRGAERIARHFPAAVDAALRAVQT